MNRTSDDESTLYNINNKSDDDESTLMHPPPLRKEDEGKDSPTTQTLNVLSQNMDDLRYPSSIQPSITSKQSKQKMAPVTTSTTLTKNITKNDNNLLWKDYQDRYDRFTITIHDSTALGMRINQTSFFPNTPNKQHCCLLSTFGTARKHGLQVGDWICLPSSSNSSHTIELALFSQVQQWSKERPFHVTVLRERSKKISFCRKCNDTTNNIRMHHGWCPKNDFFQTSGAKEVLERVQYGCQVQCSTCQQEFQTGKLAPKSMTHNKACRLNTTCTSKNNKSATTKSATDKSATKSTIPLPKQTRQESISSSSTSDEEISCYKPRSKKRTKIQTLSLAPAVDSTKNQNYQPNRASNKVTPTTAITTTTTTTTTTDILRKKAHPVSKLKLNWVGCHSNQNPWGPPGYHNGDVLLYGPNTATTLTRDSTTTTSSTQRYTIHPFHPQSPYISTHVLPDPLGGHTVLVLKRDPCSTMPWGFDFKHDEFGHGCLVTHVQPLSPAAAASLVGRDTSHHSSLPVDGLLQADDLILMINHKLVGGLTQDGVELQLHTASCHLFLVISKYKHAKLAQQTMQRAEERYWQVLDQASSDQRLLGYMEVNNNSNKNNCMSPLLRSDLPACSDPLVCTNTTPPSTQLSAIESPLLLSPSPHQLLKEREEDDASTDRVGMLLEAASQADSQPPEEVNVVLPRKKKKGSDSSINTWKQDENAWCGCVCGRIHSSQQDNMFWIQCEACDSWFDVSATCVGFTMQQANSTVESWKCWACECPASVFSPKNNHGNDPTILSSPLKKNLVDKERNQETQRMEPTLDLTKSPPINQKNPKEPLPLQTKGRRRFSSSQSSVINHNSQSTIVPHHIRKRHHKKVWDRLTPDGCLLPKTKPKRRPDGTFSKPTGHHPKLLSWEPNDGMWVPQDYHRTTIPTLSDTRNSQQPSQQQGSSTKSPLPVTAKKSISSCSTVITSSKTKARGTRYSPLSPNKLPHSASLMVATPAIMMDDSQVAQEQEKAFRKGDLVQVTPHCWPGTDCQGGIGYILDVLPDSRYLVKFVVGGSNRVSVEYMESYTFG